ncbi:MAG: SDR family NAD(P)-dependent oxidoreductase [Anaerolineales bacterium]|nr:SDR family NAD(P)-dependent oxidoreductase [Anaerolineales bacterium]
MQNKIVLVTGATSGIGFQTALALAKMGARVVITGRSQSSGESAVAEIKAASGNANVDLLTGDLSAQANVHALAEQFKARVEAVGCPHQQRGLGGIRKKINRGWNRIQFCGECGHAIFVDSSTDGFVESQHIATCNHIDGRRCARETGYG